jgi:hypothetical protein
MLWSEVAMPYQPSSKLRTDMSFRWEEWEFLVRLPGRLVVAATLAGGDRPRPSVAEGLAGIDAVAAGRSSVSRLVRDVVAAIYDEGQDDEPPAEEVQDPATAAAAVLIACRSAAALLADRVGREDADAYQHWLESIAARVCHAASAGGLFGPTGQPVGHAQRRFLAALSRAFRG